MFLAVHPAADRTLRAALKLRGRAEEAGPASLPAWGQSSISAGSGVPVTITVRMRAAMSSSRTALVSVFRRFSITRRPKKVRLHSTSSL